MKKIFLDSLPHKGTVIDWVNSVGSEVKFTYDDIENSIFIDRYNNGVLDVKYDNILYKIHTANFQNCKIGKIIGKYKDKDYKYQINKRIKNYDKDITITGRKYEKDNKGIRRRYYKYRCNICGYDSGEYYLNGVYQKELWTREANIKLNKKCACCGNNITVPHINSIVSSEETLWMVDYFQGGYEEAKKYTKTSNVSMYPRCPSCGSDLNKKIQVSRIYQTRSVGCHHCSDGFSYPEKFTYNILKQLNIEFVKQYSPDYLIPTNESSRHRKKSDFYIPSLKLVIETDGRLGHEDGAVHSRSNKTLEECVRMDKWKDEQHLKNGIKTIRINCFKSDREYIKNNILKSELKKYFSFNNLDWYKAEEYALSNLCKSICKTKCDNPNFSAKEIGDLFGVGREVTIKYLKIGQNNGWCSYNAKDEMKKNGVKNRRIKEKPVKVFKDGNKVGEFISVAEVSKVSEDIFGIKLLSKNISSVCLGKQKHHKGFTFQYIEENKQVA